MQTPPPLPSSNHNGSSGSAGMDDGGSRGNGCAGQSDVDSALPIKRDKDENGDEVKVVGEEDGSLDGMKGLYDHKENDHSHRYVNAQ